MPARCATTCQGRSHLHDELISPLVRVPGASKTLGEAKREVFRRCDREDLARIDVPTLVIHGDADRIVPIAASGQRTA